MKRPARCLCLIAEHKTNSMGAADLMNILLRKFLMPRPTRGYLIRTTLVALSAFIIFKYIFIPFRVSGQSMDPTYRDGQFNFCFTLKYPFSEIQRGDVVLVRWAGPHVMLLKRVVAVENDTIAFRDGHLYVNGQKITEPYAGASLAWELPPRKVKKNHVYVVGDNRSVPMEVHDFGQTPVSRIVGSPLW